MSVTTVAIATTRFLLGMSYYTVDTDVGKGDFSFVLGILHVCGRVSICMCDQMCLWAWIELPYTLKEETAA